VAHVSRYPISSGATLLAAAKRGIKPTKLAHLTVAATVRDGLWDAVIDAPPPRKPILKAAPSKVSRRSLPPSLSQLLAPALDGSVTGGELAGVLDS
jgi:hypothetical protein